MSQVGIVVIGRNEGARLGRCLASLSGRVVYVDSGSSDGSVALAESLGAEVVALSPPFTAARARNLGVARLRLDPAVRYVQLVDGDCELDGGWLKAALAHFAAHPRAAIVCGRLRERHPEASVYNRLCDQEWNTPVGAAGECGGNALVRLSAFVEVGGFAPELIAGEEPDLCVRLKARGWQVWRIDAPMALHDAAITRFSQWWRRSRRGGHARAEAFRRHGERRTLRALVSNLVWSLPPAWLLWPLLWWRVYRQRGDWAYATFTVLGKLPCCQGQLQFWLLPSAGLIEYK